MIETVEIIVLRMKIPCGVRDDGVAKTHQLLRCCHHLAASTYVSTPHCSTMARLAFGAFCLAIQLDAFCESIKWETVA
jgi:hypothetical protein